MEKQKLKRTAQSATLTGKDHAHPGRAGDEQNGQGVVSYPTAQEAFPGSQVPTIEANSTLDAEERQEHVLVPPAHCRTIRLLTGVAKIRPRISSSVILACMSPLQEDCFLPFLSPYLYDFPAIMPTPLVVCHHLCHASFP